MKPFDSPTPETWVHDRIEAYVDGELDPADAAQLERHVAGDATLQAEVALARRIRSELGGLPHPACPPAVTRAVLAATRPASPAPSPPRPAVPRRHRWTTYGRPALAAAGLILAVTLTTLVGRSPDPANRAAAVADVDPARVEAALAEAKWTLAYLSNLGRQTGRSVRHDVLEPHVVRPVHSALHTALPTLSDIQN